LLGLLLSILLSFFEAMALSVPLRRLQRGLVPPAVSSVQRRFLNIHEYQAQEIFSTFGVDVPKNYPAFSIAEAVEKSKLLPGDEVVVKSQVLAGGRGLGYFKENNFQGGVQVCAKDKVAEIADKMLGKTLITKQTGAEGKPNNTLMVAEKVSIDTEKYFSIMMDRASGGPLMVGCATGGTSIEDVAAATPDAIIKIPVDIMDGISAEQATKMAGALGFKGQSEKDAAALITNLYKVFIENDCTTLEINPLAQLTDGRVLVCDAKVNFDDNAEFRQKELHKLRDTSQENAIEVEAKKFDLNYIKLDGDIACMVNGAGLAMSTMDLLSTLGGTPANFLDVGGASTVETMTAAFKIIMGDPSVKSIFVNIFGGIARCDHIASAVVAGVKAVGGNDAIKPLVIRLEGTNVEEGMKIIKESGVNAFLTNDFTTGAKEAVRLSK
jgi:succinyl-CoA synthetase beta subunit